MELIDNAVSFATENKAGIIVGIVLAVVIIGAYLHFRK
jgi:hypothetical protein